MKKNTKTISYLSYSGQHALALDSNTSLGMGAAGNTVAAFVLGGLALILERGRMVGLRAHCSSPGNEIDRKVTISYPKHAIKSYHGHDSHDPEIGFHLLLRCGVHQSNRYDVIIFLFHN